MMRSKSAISAMLLCAFTVIALTGCGIQYTGNSGDGGTSCGNIVMGEGKFAYNGDFVYFTDADNLYEYDCESGLTVTFPSDSDDVKDIYLQDRYIYFSCDGLRRITKDGKKARQVFGRDNGCRQLFVDGEDAWFLESVEGDFVRRNLSDGTETVLMSGVLAYFVDDERIYVISKEAGSNDEPSLFVSGKNAVSFEKQELSFSPIAVFVAPDGMYLSERGSYQIIKCDADVETALPVYSTFYQVLDGRIYYLGKETFNDGAFTLSEYDMTTGERKDLQDEVYDFNLLGDRYIGMQMLRNHKYVLYDLKTGEVRTMYEEKEP